MATAIIHSARRMLPGMISAAGPVCGPSQLIVARPKASAPQTSDHGPIRQAAEAQPGVAGDHRHDQQQPGAEQRERDGAPDDLVVDAGSGHGQRGRHGGRRREEQAPGQQPGPAWPGRACPCARRGWARSTIVTQ